jgi:hypothetical protein
MEDRLEKEPVQVTVRTPRRRDVEFVLGPRLVISKVQRDADLR